MKSLQRIALVEPLQQLVDQDDGLDCFLEHVVVTLVPLKNQCLKGQLVAD